MTPDPIDRAREQTEALEEAALRNHHAKMAEREEPRERNGIRVCVDCTIEIPPERLERMPHAVRCVPCQDIHEQLEALHARTR